MKELEFRDLYKARNYSGEDTDTAVSYVKEMETVITPEIATVDEIKVYINQLISEEKNTIPRLIALARYFYIIDNHIAYIYFTKIFGGMGVMENIRKRLEFYTDKEIAESIFNKLPPPAIGTPPERIPEYTNEVMKRLKSALSPAMYRKVLAGNNHGIPEESMLAEKKLYEESQNIDTYLKERHERKVAELQMYCDENKVWFEQEISQEMVDYVKQNQEILSAIRKDNKLYVTKIPFDGINFLTTDDPILKNYYACHCPFARERILDEFKENIDPDWCYCSAGFAKFPFEVILGEELEVEMLKSALRGDQTCRFAITLPKKEQSSLG